MNQMQKAAEDKFNELKRNRLLGGRRKREQTKEKIKDNPTNLGNKSEVMGRKMEKNFNARRG